MCRTTLRSCATKRYVRRNSPCRSWRRFRIWACTETSRAETGSSATTRRGFSASARAMPIRWRSPPLNACGYRRMYSGRSPTRRSRSATRSSRSRRLFMPWTRRGSPTRSSSVMRGLSEEKGSWKIICISRRRARSSFRPSLPTSTTEPSVTRMRISPPVGSIARMMHRAVVVLPQPLSPTRPSVSPWSMWKSTPSTART